MYIFNGVSQLNEENETENKEMLSHKNHDLDLFFIYLFLYVLPHCYVHIQAGASMFKQLNKCKNCLMPGCPNPVLGGHNPARILCPTRHKLLELREVGPQVYPLVRWKTRLESIARGTDLGALGLMCSYTMELFVPQQMFFFIICTRVYLVFANFF